MTPRPPALVPVKAAAAFAVATPALLQVLLRRTYLGRAIRAVAQNADSCTLVGIDPNENPPKLRSGRLGISCAATSCT